MTEAMPVEPKPDAPATAAEDGGLIDPAVADNPLFDGLPGDYVPEQASEFDHYDPGDIACPLDSAGFSGWQGWDGPCVAARINPGSATALAPVLSFDESDQGTEEVLLDLPPEFTISAWHQVGSIGQHLLEVQGRCDGDGIWRESSPVRIWVWVDRDQRLRRVVWRAPDPAVGPTADSPA